MVRLNLIQSLPLIAALLLPATLTAQERVKLTVEQPTGGSVTVSPEPGADGTVSKIFVKKGDSVLEGADIAIVA